MQRKQRISLKNVWKCDTYYRKNIVNFFFEFLKEAGVNSNFWRGVYLEFGSMLSTNFMIWVVLSGIQ